MKYFSSLFFFLFLVFANWSCSHQSMPVAKPGYAADGKYDSGPLVQGASAQLDKIAQSIYRLNVIAFYESYSFKRDAKVTLHKFRNEEVEDKAVSHSISNESVLGTASVIYSGNNRAVLLTCAHVVGFQDTLVTYFPDTTGIISNISIKIKQKSYVAGFENSNVKLLAVDKQHDIALLEAVLSADEHVRVMPFPLGKSSDLDWGTFVYVMGFPKGQKMVESGIVSRAEKRNSGFFLTNAIFNSGISGGPVFAVRNGSSRFEWVGMAQSSPATNIFYLEPSVNKTDVYSRSEPYKGELLINKKKVINYGITFSVSMEEIVRFVKSIEFELEQEGFDAQQFFYHQPK